MQAIYLDDGSCRELSPAELLRELLPVETPSHLGVTLINGPYAGLRLVVTQEGWDGGKMNVNGCDYVRKGRDNAGWEFANLQNS